MIKKDDNVIILTGKDKGKTGKVTKSMPKEGKIIVSGINMMKKHQKPRQKGQTGQVIDVSMPIHISNVRLESAKKAAKKTVKAEKPAEVAEAKPKVAKKAPKATKEAAK